MQYRLISLAIFACALFGILPVQVTSTVLYSYTKSNKLCMTGCGHYSNYDFCYLGWGASYWDYCTPGTIPAPQYFTAYKTVVNQKTCTSLCGYFGSSTSKGTWCFTGDRGRWDYCSKGVGLTIYGNKCTGDCTRPGVDEGYQCPVGHGQPTFEPCSPNPDDSEFVDFTKDLLFDRKGMFLKDEGFRPCATRAKRSDEHILKTLGVDAMYNHYALFHTVRDINDPAVPVTAYIVDMAPTRNNIPDVELTYAVRARIYPRHRTVRGAIPGFVAQRFELMDAYPSDERGHLLAASLGGPNHQENFVPQTSIVNRATDGVSYWFLVEAEIRGYLDGAPGNHVEYVDWTVIVIYGNVARNRRPIGFGLRYVARDIAGAVIHDSGNMYFSNDINGGDCI